MTDSPQFADRPNAYFDAEGRFIHNCEICGAPAYQGRNVNLRQGQLGTWRCAQHLWGKLHDG
jgi:hypothetical protein